jgi:DNA-binding MarR family transcriptional regulator
MTAVPRTRRELTEVLREIAWTVHRRAPERAGVGPLPTTEIALLKQVISTPGATVGQLAEALGLRQPNASAAIRVLADKGLVTKEPSPDDRRIVRIVPTELGSSEHAEIAAAWTQPLDDAIASLSEEDQAALDAAAEALVALYAALRPAEQ